MGIMQMRTVSSLSPCKLHCNGHVKTTEDTDSQSPPPPLVLLSPSITQPQPRVTALHALSPGAHLCVQDLLSPPPTFCESSSSLPLPTTSSAPHRESERGWSSTHDPWESRWPRRGRGGTQGRLRGPRVGAAAWPSSALGPAPRAPARGVWLPLVAVTQPRGQSSAAGRNTTSESFLNLWLVLAIRQGRRDARIPLARLVF